MFEDVTVEILGVGIAELIAIFIIALMVAALAAYRWRVRS